MISSLIAKITLVLLFIVLLLNPVNIQAQEVQPATSSGNASSFESFWPLSAGKTIDDSLYFLKIWKENLRGVLIFGLPQKADYAVFLGTKRVLEAEKLIQVGKKDLAEQTFKKASEQFDIAEKNIDAVLSKKQLLGSSISTMRPRLDNLTLFLPQLDTPESDRVLSKVKSIRSKL